MSGRILIVEDDAGHRRTLSLHLSMAGHEVYAVEGADVALRAVASLEPDLVITDIRMPGLTGFDLLNQLRDVDSDVVMITAYEGLQGAIDAMKGGAYEYLTKPLDLDRLEEVVEACLSDRRRRQGQENGREALAGALEGAVTRDNFGKPIVARDPAMVRLCKLIGRVARTRTSVLIRGETGTGKELVARAIHANSAASEQPFVAVDCTAIPEHLLESELFGYEAGAFTDAKGPRKGRFEIAGGGTVFLDEVGDMPASVQAKLLRVLQEREFYPLGSESPRRTAARVIAATHRPILDMVRSGHFREDLYFRLRVVEIAIPPLRERRGDIPLLVSHVLAGVAEDLGTVPVVPDEVMNALVTYDWPGNVRELENALTRAAVLSDGAAISLEGLELGGSTKPSGPRGPGDGVPGETSLEDVERAHIQRVLVLTSGNKSRAARILKISRPRLDRMISKHGLSV